MARKTQKSLKAQKAIKSPFFIKKELEGHDLKAHEVYAMFDSLWLVSLATARNANEHIKTVIDSLEMALKYKPEHVDAYLQYLEGKAITIRILRGEDMDKVLNGKPKKGRTTKENPKPQKE